MLNSLILSIQQAPKLLVGFVVLFLVLLVLVFRDPPTTICDVQMQAVQEELSQGFFVQSREGLFGQSVMTAFNFCIETNSPGGCLDLFSRLKFYEKRVKTIPTECGADPATGSIKKGLEKALRLFAQISWGEVPPKNQYEKTAWLETSDLGLYCRLKRQHLRLYGKEAWQLFAWSVLSGLPESRTLTRKELWKKSLFSYPCAGLY